MLNGWSRDISQKFSKSNSVCNFPGTFVSMSFWATVFLGVSHCKQHENNRSHCEVSFTIFIWAFLPWLPLMQSYLHQHKPRQIVSICWSLSHFFCLSAVSSPASDISVQATPRIRGAAQHLWPYSPPLPLGQHRWRSPWAHQPKFHSGLCQPKGEAIELS